MTATVAPGTGTTTYVFTRSLTLGSTGSDVKNLQIFLNTHGFAVALAGAGSAGNETMYFGPATQKAVAMFQRKNFISPTAGFFGPVTMKAVNALNK